jgi:hypothetical protein
MKAKFRLLAIAGAIFMLNSVFCQEPYILYICDNTDDSGFTDVLENAGYNVVRKIGEYRGTLDPDELEYANNASLIIISRNCVSTEYGGTEELAAQWNGISTPILDLSVFSTRDSRWKWFNTSVVICGGDTLTIPASAASHPLYEGIATSGKQTIYTEIGSDYIYINNAGNGKVLAYNSDQTGIFIAEWNAGKPFYDGAAYTPAGKRIFFAAGESDCGPSAGQNMSAYNLNGTGKKMFLNIVNYLIPAATFYKFPDGLAPVIDGQVDPLWTYVDAYALKLYDLYNPPAGTPTLDLATWRAAWNDTAIFIIIKVDDDDFYPDYAAGSTLSWEYDRAEIYFDLNVGELDDGMGPVSHPNGHVQIAEPFNESRNPYITDYVTWNGYYVRLGYLVNDPDYVCEYAIDISYLLDKYNNVVNPSSEPVVGFDIAIIDRDEGDAGKRTAVWRNTGEHGLSWANMDDCGEVAFSNTIVGSPDATFYKFPDGCAPVIDGTVDPLWKNVETHHINRTCGTEEPTLNLATWQAAWNDTSIFILITVDDDDFYPTWESDDLQWMSDKPEIYFDVNDELKDAGGPVYKPGHYQIAPWFYNSLYQYTETGYQWSGMEANVYSTISYNVSDPDYIYEYAINIEDLRDENGISLNPYTMDMIGFDVTIADRDAGDNGRRRAVWKNIGAVDESWNNMDDCGIVTFSTNTVASFLKPEIKLKDENILICIDSGLYSYQWYYNNEIITGETKQFCRVNPNYSGNYYVQTGYGNQCKTMSDPFSFTAKSGTLRSGEPLIEIYPVPNTGNFTLKMISDESGRVLINIRDYAGTMIKSLIIDKNDEPLSEEISISNIPKGIYIVDILFNNMTYYRKLVIN